MPAGLRIGILITCALLVLGVGCGTQPIPEIAVEGTTVLIPIPGHYEVGYGTSTVRNAVPLSVTASSTITLGTALATADTALEDFQRGELVLTLMQWNSGSSEYEEVVNLPVRYVAAVSADPGSERGRTVSPAENRQSVIAVDIPFLRDEESETCETTPCSLVPDASAPIEFEIRVRRFRRSSFTNGARSYVEMKQSHFDLSENPGTAGDSEWFGWGRDAAGPESPADFIPIQIADSAVAEAIEEDPLDPDHPQTKTQFEYWYASNPLSPATGGIHRAALSQADQGLPRPDPEFTIAVDSPTESLAAWTLNLSYPAHHITITDVRPVRTKPTGGFVTYTATPTTPPACSSTTSGLLKVSVADPEAITTGVIVSYRLSAGFAGCVPALAPLIPGDLSGISVTGYDVDGVVVSDATHHGPMGPDFQDL